MDLVDFTKKRFSYFQIINMAKKKHRIRNRFKLKSCQKCCFKNSLLRPQKM